MVGFDGQGCMPTKLTPTTIGVIGGVKLDDKHPEGGQI
jgi:hypothetical protein